MDENDALIVSPPQATWMDADPSGTGKTIVTPQEMVRQSKSMPFGMIT